MQKYDFSFVIRSDDYYPAAISARDTGDAVKTVLLLDNSARFDRITADLTEQGTGNLCTFNTVIEAETKPDTWIKAARDYARLRDLNYEIVFQEIKEPEPDIPVSEIHELESPIPEIPLNGFPREETKENPEENPEEKPEGDKE
jgi:hypothetical protein